MAAGALTATASVVVIAWALGATPEVLRSIAPKTSTVPIAMSISEEIGGIPALTAILTVPSGIIAALIFGAGIFDWIGVHHWAARGVACGVAGGATGAQVALAANEEAGAFASLAIGLTGLFTAVALPLAVTVISW